MMRKLLIPLLLAAATKGRRVMGCGKQHLQPERWAIPAFVAARVRRAG